MNKQAALDWTGDAQAVMATLNASSHSNGDRAYRDYYATPKRAVEELLRIETFGRPIWEPACGERHISSILEQAGLNVRSTDIEDRGNDVLDFLGTRERWDGDIVTNPPFAMATEFLIKALSLVPDGNKVCLFLRIQFLEGVKRRKVFESNPPIRVWVASRNLRCAKNGDFASASGNASTYCWFVWEKGYKGSPSIGWFN